MSCLVVESKINSIPISYLPNTDDSLEKFKILNKQLLLVFKRKNIDKIC